MSKRLSLGGFWGNDCIEDVLIGSDSEPPSPHVRPYELKIRNWPIRELDEAALEKMSKDCDLFLDGYGNEDDPGVFSQAGEGADGY